MEQPRKASKGLCRYWETHHVVDSFHAADADNTGNLDKRQLKGLLRNLKLPCSSVVVDQLFPEVDVDGDGRITLEEFETFVNRHEAIAVEAFERADSHHDGYITHTELHDCVKRLGIVATPSEVDALFQSMDADRSGRVSFDEFLDGVWGLMPYNVTTWEDMFSQSCPPVRGPVAAPGYSSVQTLLGGLVAGVVSRSATAPLDRAKLIQQAGGTVHAQQGSLLGVLRRWDQRQRSRFCSLRI